MVKIRPPNWKIPGPNCLLQLDLRCQSTQQKTMEPEVSSRSTCWHFLDDAVQAAKPLWQKLPSRLQPAAACLSRTIQYLLYVHSSRAGVVMSKVMSRDRQLSIDLRRSGQTGLAFSGEAPMDGPKIGFGS